MEVIAAQGFARTTPTEVARRAGFSLGLVNLHLSTTEGLLAGTMRSLAQEDRENWEAALAAAPPAPAARLNALLLADFEPCVRTPARLAAWCAFRGEAQSRPLDQETCASNDEDHVRAIEAICAALLADGYEGDPRAVARVLGVTTEGVRLDLMTMSAPYPRDEALRVVMTCAQALFPRHLTTRGLR